MKLVWKSYSICKEGNREDENEDAVFPQLVNGTSLTADQFTCAMADGATTSSFSKLWANLLVNESSRIFATQQDFSQVLYAARSIWKNELTYKELPWPAAIKVKQGSFSTLLCFQIWKKSNMFLANNSTSEKGWTAQAIGDTCLFHVIRNRFTLSFPFTQADQFSNTPDLISTNLAYQKNNNSQKSISGTWQRGDHFLIASDALAAWIMEGIEKNLLLWPMISENLTSLVRYQSWVRSLRRQKKIKNDDTTIIAMSVDD